MGLESLTTTLRGETSIPQTSADWQDWVSATQMRNYIGQSALSDWLDLYGEERGFVRDDRLPAYDARLDFGKFITKKGNEFEAAIVEHLRTLTDVRTIVGDWREGRDLGAARRTFEAMREGVPILHQVPLRDPESRTYGLADLLLRADLFATLFPADAQYVDSGTAAPDLGEPWHYVVLDIKFTTPSLTTRGTLGDGGSLPAYKAQLHVYNRALGRLQGHAPRYAFLLGRGVDLGRGQERTTNALERLAPVDLDPAAVKKRGLSVQEMVERACDWQRRVRKEGAAWSPLPVPSVPELWPNAGSEGFDWGCATSHIAKQLGELTQLWQVGLDKRANAHAAGITSWLDPRTNLNALGVKTGGTTGPKLQAILDVNHDASGPPVRPAHVSAAEDEWRATPALEFFVDFEYVIGVNDDFTRIPKQNGHPLIFMIGCGHVQGGEWIFRCFIAHRLTEGAEAAMIDEWLAHMAQVQAGLGSRDAPRVHHWAHAEKAWYDMARERHPDRAWPDVRWYDLLAKVIREQPVVVRGALGFGLKEFSGALHSHGLIATDWGNTNVDGSGAMTGAWWCDEEAEHLGGPLRDIPLMQEIAAYNEVDTKVMMEILHYLRRHH